MTPEQFGQIYRAQVSEISRFLSRRVEPSEVEDLASELFEIAWNKRAQIPEGMELPWLYKTARYLISNHRRKLQNRNRIMVLFQPVLAAPSAESIALEDMELSSAWARLTEQEQEVLGLWALEGLDNKALAQALEVSVNAATIRLSRARQKLKDQLAVERNS
jgi:RNA polymerase sigma factor (sigma-70 family)